jgi:hypothetical protein
MPTAASPHNRTKHSRSSSTFIKWYKLVNVDAGCVRSVCAMRNNFAPKALHYLARAVSFCLACTYLTSLSPAWGGRRRTATVAKERGEDSWLIWML